MAKKRTKTNNRRYQITPVIWFVKDEDSVKFHVKNDDYFGTIATILNLVEQKIAKEEIKDKNLLEKSLKNIKDDLMFLQNNYKIMPKIDQKKKTPK